MSFQSTMFFCFFCVLLVLLAVSKKEKLRQIEILTASVVFYAAWDIRFLILAVICILAAHFTVKKMLKNSKTRHHSDNKKRVLIIGIAVQLGMLCVFKYLKFFVADFIRLIGAESPGTLNIILPVGISFYIFSAIGYIVDVYRGDIEKQAQLYQEALFILFFPKLLQGPLHKAGDFLEQLKNEHPVKMSNIEAGMQIFLFGLIKKVVIADRLGLFVDNVYANPVAYSGGTLLLAALTYPIQLYCDFSGYSDMAVATAKMMGYELCQNFNLPFLSKNVAEYWRRWHMSLNVWFRDYLFYPLIRSGWVNTIRKKTKRKSKKLSKNISAILGMLIVWPLIGLWHGASVNYVLHGCCYGVLMIIGQITRSSSKTENKVIDALCVFRTQLITIFLLILFRTSSISNMGVILKGILIWQRGISYIYIWAVVFIPLVMAVSVYAYNRNDGNGFYINLDMSKLKSKIIFCTAVIMTIVLMYVGENYFMYFQF